MVEEVARDVEVEARGAAAAFTIKKVRLTATPRLHGNRIKAALVVKGRIIKGR
jgi:hypothetical protein